MASSLWGVVYSDDASCTFAGAEGDVTETVITDLFVDRVHPERVYAIGYDDRVSAAPAPVSALQQGQNRMQQKQPPPHLHLRRPAP